MNRNRIAAWLQVKSRSTARTCPWLNTIRVRFDPSWGSRAPSQIVSIKELLNSKSRSERPAGVPLRAGDPCPWSSKTASAKARTYLVNCPLTPWRSNQIARTEHSGTKRCSFYFWTFYFWAHWSQPWFWQKDRIAKIMLIKIAYTWFTRHCSLLACA